MIMERIQEAKAGFGSLTEAIDTTTAPGRMMMQMVGAFAEFERAILRERTKAGLDAARKQGRIGRRRPKLRPNQQDGIVTMVSMSTKTAADAARLFNVHPATVSRLLAKAGAVSAPGTKSRRSSVHQIGPFPATLFFPASVVDELNEICETLGYTAVNGHSAQWKKERRSTTPTGGKRLPDLRQKLSKVVRELAMYCGRFLLGEAFRLNNRSRSNPEFRRALRRCLIRGGSYRFDRHQLLRVGRSLGLSSCLPLRSCAPARLRWYGLPFRRQALHGSMEP